MLTSACPRSANSRMAAARMRRSVALTGVAEVLGAAGLILPRALHIVPGLAGFAALGLAITMVGAVVVHARRGEYNEAGINVALLVLCVVVAAGRL